MKAQKIPALARFARSLGMTETGWRFARSLGMTTFAVAAIAVPAGAQKTVASTKPVITKFTVSGIPVILKRVTGNDVIAVRLYLKGGSAALQPGKEGIENFIGVVAERGTAKYSGDEIAARATSTGTRLGFEIANDYTAFLAQGVRQNWGTTWDLFTQVALHPTFPADEVEQGRGRILNAIKQRVDDPDDHLSMLADSVMYVGHAYAMDPAGSVSSVEKLTRDDLAEWHRRRMTKANLLLVVVGNVSQADLTAKVRAAFGTLPATGGEPAKMKSLATLQPDLVVVQQELPTNYILGIYSVPDPGSPDFPAMRVAARVLSERLFEEVRTKRNLSYAVSSGIGTRAQNSGSLYVTAVDPDTTIKVMIAEVRKLQQEPVPVDRLKQSINVFATGLLMSQQTNMGQAAALGLWELNGGGWHNSVSYVSRLRKVTPAQVQAAATKYLRNARFVVIGDPSKIDRKVFIVL